MNIEANGVRVFLAKALFGESWEENLGLVVHRQGNLPNPQQIEKASAFFTYCVRTYTKKTVNSDFGDTHTADLIVTLDLQGIGVNAETMMLTTFFWDQRSDVRTELAKLNCVLIESPREIVATPYFQDGANTTLAYETVFKLSCTLTLKEELEPMPSLELFGSLQIPNIQGE